MAELFLKGRSIGGFQGVLFDKDGTLSHSEPYLDSLANIRIEQAILLFKKKGKKPHQISKLKELLNTVYGLTQNGINPGGILAVGSRLNNLLSTATIFCLVGESWPDALRLANQAFSAAGKVEHILPRQTKQRGLLPGAKTLLSSLTQSGLKCALISNDSSVGIENFLMENNLRKTFDFCWSAEHNPAKPDPRAVVQLCNSLGLIPSQCVLIGDADSDLQMARDADIGVAIGYTSGWNIAPKLKAHQYLIEHWDDLTVRGTPKVPDKFDSP